MSNYKFKKLNPNQFDLLIPLMLDSFGMKANIDYFKWKFIDNPAGDFIGFIAVDEETNETAAYYGVIPEDYVIGSEKRTIYQSCDTMTHSRHRRKGLFKTLAIKCYEYLEEKNELFVIGFGGGQSTPGFLKFGWKHIFDFRNLFVPNILCYSTLLKKFPDDNFEIITDTYRLKRLFEDEQKNLSKIHSLRNAANVKWRYDNPLVKYKILAYKKDLTSDIEGFISYYVSKNKLFIFDFVFLNSNSRKALIYNLKKQVIKEKLSGIVAFCKENSHPELELRRSGFLSNPFKKGPLNQKTPFIFYTDKKTMNEFENPDFWSIKSYDHDSY